MKPRYVVLALVAVTLAALGVLATASPAAAHPLGNFSVNQYQALSLRPDRIDVSAVVDTAEIPTLQEASAVDADRSGQASNDELARHADTACRDLADGFEVRLGRDRLTWTVTRTGFGYAPGTGGLQTSRLTCSLSAPARLGAATSVVVTNRYRVDRVGWREMTAVGDGVRLVGSPLPDRSVSDELRAYPDDLLSSALDVRSARLRVEPGAGAAAGSRGVTADSGSGLLSRWTLAAERRFTSVVGEHRITPIVGVLAVLLAILLGAGHAALPGHGKTVLAAYLAGQRGRIRDAVAVGATVTVTHTGGVLLVGLLLSTSTALAGDQIVGYLGLVSGVLVTAVGIGMIVNAVRGRTGHGHGHHGHGHAHGPHDEHDGHAHGPHDEHHGHPHGRRTGRLSLAGIGLAGGLVPSPSALVVLLGAIALGRAGFGVVLVIGYGLGMAGALTLAGLLLVVLQRRVARAAGRPGIAARLSAVSSRLRGVASMGTAGLVVVVGLGLAARAVAGVV